MNERTNPGSTTTASVERRAEKPEGGVSIGKHDPNSWQTLVSRGVPSLGAIAVTFLIAPPDWVQVIMNGGGTCVHNGGC